MKREEIESLGFLHYKSGEARSLKQKYDGYRSEELNLGLVHYPYINKVSIFTIDPSKDELYIKTNFDYNRVVFITCDTIEQLGDLLNRIGYDG